ncbi:MAG: Anti-sigma factor antagonist [Solirubrobacterales bacterium]|nr:Anti-sigma factor antagonist [Solirubrobacterales bacterium]
MRLPTFTGTFGITAEPAPYGTAIVARGELDAAAVSELHARLEQALESGSAGVLLDLERVWFIESISLAAIVGAQQRMGDGGRLVVVTRHPYVLLIIEAGGLGSVIEVHPTREEAEAALLDAPGGGSRQAMA